MKKLLSVLMLATMVLAFTGFASATTCATVETTFVSGLISDATNGNAPVAGATVQVTCDGTLKTTTSDALGGYQVEYTPAECDNGDTVSVHATYDGLSGDSSTVDWYTENNQIGCLELIVNVACANVPLVPEFGALVAGLTILGALGAFFVVRRK
jgi:hypothetical protein